jgi:L-aminopeptidase/D-esterase-like protein
MRLKLFLTAPLVLLAATLAQAAQDQLVVNTAISGPVLTFDWPAVQIGTGSYEDGPTGLTIFRFPDRVSAAVDVRGGGPGTVNTDLLRLGYGAKLVDAIVFSGGSSYGEEPITAVMTGLKDDGVRSGGLGDIAIAAGAVIYDFFGHRLNDIYPDKRLTQAALRAARPGIFPLGAQGAGRMAMQGSYFGCNAHSGQGGAFRQIGPTKIAAFVVVNAFGAVTDRAGRLVSCNRAKSWGNLETTSELLQHLPESLKADWDAEAARQHDGSGTRNTTVSLIVTSQKLGYAALQRLAIQVHTSMARAIQPFSTEQDGDTLYAASTQETDNNELGALTLTTLGAESAEAMWDAVLASVPEEPAFDPPPAVTVAPEHLAGLVGRYKFGPQATINIEVQDGNLMLRLVGAPFFDLRSELTALRPVSTTEFYVDSRYRSRLVFTVGADGRATAATVNPGHWAQRGDRLPD